MTALVILLIVAVALALYAVVSWRLGPEDEVWFPENHWRLP
jgi:hypothetical protein